MNIRDLGNNRDVFTITSDGKIGIGSTTPGFMLEIDAPNQFGLQLTGPNARSVGAGMRLLAVNPARELLGDISDWWRCGSGSRQTQHP